MIPPDDVAKLRAAFAANPNDLGVGLFNPTTGEVRLGSFDRVTDGKGHQGLADALGIVDNRDWRGFIVEAGGRFLPRSHFNAIDGSAVLLDECQTRVREALTDAGLLS